MRSPARIAAVAVVALAAAVAVAVLVSAALDRPARSFHTELTIDAPSATVWALLADFGGYDTWNPLMTEAAGEARLGARLEIHLERPGGEAQDISPEITILRPGRKLAWMSRSVLPGVLDREHEVIVERVRDDRVRVLVHERVEGLLVPFTSTAGQQEGLELMVAALARRAEAATGG